MACTMKRVRIKATLSDSRSHELAFSPKAFAQIRHITNSMNKAKWEDSVIPPRPSQLLSVISAYDSFLVKRSTTPRVYLIPTDEGIIQSHFLQPPSRPISIRTLNQVLQVLHVDQRHHRNRYNDIRLCHKLDQIDWLQRRLLHGDLQVQQ